MGTFSRLRRLTVLLLLGLVPVAGVAAETVGEVLADRVNLRSRPNLQGEVVGQLSRHQRVRVRGVSGEWLEVVPPASVDLWVHSAFVSNGVVVAKRLNVRAGPNINYRVVGRLDKGTAVQVRGRQGEWLRIAPPESCSLWVNRRYVRLLSSRRARQRAVSPRTWRVPRPRAVAPAASITAQVFRARRATPVVMVATVQTRRVELPQHWNLVPLEGQGRVVWREGEIRRIPFMLGAPTRFKLVERSGGTVRMLCYLWGDEQQLARFAGRKLKIKGREYWLSNHRYPVVAVEALQLTRETRLVPQAE